jgi:hypothetical protein
MLRHDSGRIKIHLDVRVAVQRGIAMKDVVEGVIEVQRCHAANEHGRLRSVLQLVFGHNPISFYLFFCHEWYDVIKVVRSNKRGRGFPLRYN